MRYAYENCIHYALYENDLKIVTVLDTYSDRYVMPWIVYFCDQARVENNKIEVFSVCTLFISDKFGEILATWS